MVPDRGCWAAELLSWDGKHTQLPREPQLRGPEQVVTFRPHYLHLCSGTTVPRWLCEGLPTAVPGALETLRGGCSGPLSHGAHTVTCHLVWGKGRHRKGSHQRPASSGCAKTCSGFEVSSPDPQGAAASVLSAEEEEEQMGWERGPGEVHSQSSQAGVLLSATIPRRRP